MMTPPLPKDSTKAEDFPDFMESCIALGKQIITIFHVQVQNKFKGSGHRKQPNRLFKLSGQLFSFFPFNVTSS